jgi:transcriptional regulator with XRE-family HTH domain
MGQDALAQKTGLTQGYISLIESGEFDGATEDAIGRIAAALDVEPWVLLAQAHGLLIREVEPFGDGERNVLDAFRELDDEQREVVLKVAAMMKRPPPRRKPTKRG